MLSSTLARLKDFLPGSLSTKAPFTQYPFAFVMPTRMAVIVLADLIVPTRLKELPAVSVPGYLTPVVEKLDAVVTVNGFFSTYLDVPFTSLTHTR